MIGSPLAAATARKWYSSSAGVGTYTIAGSTMSPAAPRPSASRAKLTAAAVVSSETPAMTGTLPSPASTAAASGMLDDRELKILSDVTDWTSVNGEAIFATRPWKISGQAAAASIAPAQDASFNESKRKTLTADDVRFTTKGQTLYAFVMGWPDKKATIAPLGNKSPQAPGKIEHVELIGFPGKLKWERDEVALHIVLPENKPSDHAVAFRIEGKGIV